MARTMATRTRLSRVQPPSTTTRVIAWCSAELGNREVRGSRLAKPPWSALRR